MVPCNGDTYLTDIAVQVSNVERGRLKSGRRTSCATRHISWLTSRSGAGRLSRVGWLSGGDHFYFVFCFCTFSVFFIRSSQI